MSEKFFVFELKGVMLGLGRKMISVSQIIANGNKSHLTNEEIEKDKNKKKN